MKKLITIWQAMAIASLIVAVLYLCSCKNAQANTNESEVEYYLEDNFTVAPSEGICLQDVYFDNGLPLYNGKPCVFTEDVCELLTHIFYGNNWKEYPVAAIAFNCGSYYVIELD